jgi:hypothetical protein
MEIELHPAVSMLPETFTVPIAPTEMLIEALNSYLNLQRYKVLYISGNYSRILSRLNRNFTEVEHDPMLYEDAKEMVEYVAQTLKQTSREATVLLYSPALDPHLQAMTDLADRVFCFYEGQAKERAKSNLKMQGAQKTLEAYS